jgi:hypothetical protein
VGDKSIIHQYMSEHSPWTYFHQHKTYWNKA